MSAMLLKEYPENDMNTFYLISGIVALALFVYLFIALLKPEKF